MSVVACKVVFLVLVLGTVDEFVSAQNAFDLDAFQRSLESSCKCGQAFYTPAREQRRLSAMTECLSQRFPEVEPFQPQGSLESSCPQAALSTYARINEYTQWKQQSLSPEDARIFDVCVFGFLGYTNSDGSANHKAFQKEITTAFLENSSLNRDKDSIVFMQTLVARAKSPVCTQIQEIGEYVRCSLKPCFGSAAVPKF